MAKQKSTSPRQLTLIDIFFNEFKDKFGYPYAVVGGRDGKIFKELLRSYDEETLKRCIRLFFQDEDPWLDGKREVHVFKIRLNRYLEKVAKARQHENVPAHRPMELK